MDHSLTVDQVQEKREYMRAYNAEYYAKNREKLKKYRAAYGRKHAKKLRDRTAAWKRSNPAKVSAAVLARRSFKRSRIHPASNRSIEVALYEQAERLTESTGELHHVDHIIPLAAGGWHHHMNLQVLPALVNMTKHTDPFWTGPRFKSWRDVPPELWPEKLAKKYEAILRDEHALAA